MSSTGQNDRERRWIEEVRAGDERAFEEMFCTYHARLCAFAATYVKSVAVAKDLVQEVFARIWQRRECWDPQGTVQAYLYKAVRNRTADHHRRKQVRAKHAEEVTRVFSEESPLTPLESLTQEELEAYIRRAIEELPESRRRIFVLSRAHQLTYEEIAETLDISVHTVHTQIKRALRFLRERLAAYLREEQQTTRYVEGAPPLHLN